MNESIERVKCLHTFPCRTKEEERERFLLLIQWAHTMRDPNLEARVATLKTLHERTHAEQDELWYKKNLLEHEVRWEQGTLEEVVLYGRSMTPANKGRVQHPLHRTMNSKEWEMEQRLCVGAHIGDIIFLQRLSTDVPTVFVTYAMRRIPSPFRWTKYVIYHSSQESCEELMNHLEARYMPPAHVEETPVAVASTSAQ